MYRASSRKDCYDLAWALENTPVIEHPFIAAQIIYHRLMLGPWWFMVLVWLIKRSKPHVALRKLTFFYLRMPGEASHLVMETCRHIRHGEDREDTTSVGGFSQREMNIMASIIARPSTQEGA